MKRLHIIAGITVAALASGCSSDSASLEKPTTTSGATSGVGSKSTTTSPQSNCRQPDLERTVAYRIIEGANKNLTSLDVYSPPQACNSPVVMWVHGGGYIRGDKSNQIKDKAKLFNDQGWTLVSVNYRLSRPPKSQQANRNAQFPNHYDDVAASVAWVKSNIGKYGGDGSRIAILGHSAGADIVSNVTVNPAYLAEYNLKLATLTCAAPLDTEGFNKPVAGASDPDGEKVQWQSALGNNPNYLTETSATLNIKADIGIPPMLTVVRGSAQRQSIEQGFADALTAANIDVTVIDAKKLTHAQVSNRIGAANDSVITAPLVKFLTGCFQG